jgi:hypothetical protein
MCALSGIIRPLRRGSTGLPGNDTQQAKSREDCCEKEKEDRHRSGNSDYDYRDRRIRRAFKGGQ